MMRPLFHRSKAAATSASISRFLFSTSPMLSRSSGTSSSYSPSSCCSTSITPKMTSCFRFCSSSSGGAAAADDFDFDVTAAIAQDAENLSQQQKVQNLVQAILPPNAPEEAHQRLIASFTKEPINECIQAERVVITHVANEAGEDSKLKLPEMSFEEAMEQAKNNERDLQQVAMNRGVAYCRLRDAKGKALASVKDLIGGGAGGSTNDETASNNAQDGGDAASSAQIAAAMKNFKKRDMKLHTFRDVVNAHFCDWKGVKIANELSRGHSIKLQILQFVSPVSASKKMQELMEKVKFYAENDKDFDEGLKQEPRPPVGHQSTGIHVSEKELAVTLQPTGPGGNIKHPSPNDWKASLKRHEQICSKTGRKGLGTYEESKVLKPTKVPARNFRVDKYGRRLD